MHTLEQKVDVEIPQLLGHHNASKTFTLKQKVRQKHVPLSKKSAPVRLRDGIAPPSETPLPGGVKRCFC